MSTPAGKEPLEALSFDSDDVDLVEATVSSLYSKLRIDAVGEDTRTRITRRVLADGLGFDDLDYSFDIGYAGEAQGNLIVCEVLTNSVRRVGEGNDETFGAGDLFLISRPDLPYEGVAHSPRLRFTVLDPAILDRITATDGGAGGPTRILDHRPASPDVARHLQQVTAYVRDSVLDSPEAADAPLVVSAAGQYLAASVLQAFGSTAPEESPPGSGNDSNESTLRRGVAFIEANPRTDIALVDIARAAYVTPRALQLAFRRHLDTTPMAYLRRVRLDHAHAELRQADPDGGTTVSRVAVDWGFANPSRFAEYHRAAFGESPSETLAR